jgi:hypothetical protein
MTSRLVFLEAKKQSFSKRGKFEANLLQNVINIKKSVEISKFSLKKAKPHTRFSILK